MRCAKCGKEFQEGSVCPFCGGENIITEEETAIPVLKNETGKRKLKKMDKIIIVIVAVVLVIAIAVAAAVIKSKNKQNDTNNKPTVETQEEPTQEFKPVTISEDVSVTLSGISTEFADSLEEFEQQAGEAEAFKPEATAAFSQNANTPTQKTPNKNQITPEQYLEATTVITTEPANTSSNAVKTIAAFFNGKYYFDGEMISGSEKSPMEIAMDGDDFEVFTEMEGTDIAMMKLDGKIYLLNPDAKKYAEINAAVKKMMGLNDDTFDFKFNKVKFDAANPNSVTNATYKSESAVCYTYENSDTKLQFIAVNDEIRQMTLFGKDGKADTVLQADEFTAEIPSGMLSFKGYSKTNIISFMSSMM